MFSYTPDNLPAGAPLVVVLHGCGQGAEAFAAGAGWLGLADRHGFALLCPEQKRANNPNACFNWFRPDDVSREGGEAHSIAQMTRMMIESHALDSNRVFVAGLSAGGAMANAMLATYPELFHAGALIAGMPFNAARSMHEALVAMRRGAIRAPETLADAVRAASDHRGPWPKISIWQGDADATVAPANAGQIVRQWADVHQLPDTPPLRENFGPRQRTHWRNARGEVVLELNLIAGFGHGWGLSTAGADGCGAPGPYLTETGISTSAEILRFWGIHNEQARAAPARLEFTAPARQPRSEKKTTQSRSSLKAAPAPKLLIADQSAQFREDARATTPSRKAPRGLARRLLQVLGWIGGRRK